MGSLCVVRSAIQSMSLVEALELLRRSGLAVCLANSSVVKGILSKNFVGAKHASHALS